MLLVASCQQRALVIHGECCDNDLRILCWVRSKVFWLFAFFHFTPSARTPYWSTTLGLRHVYTERRKISRSEGVQQELNTIHYPRAAACIFTRLRANSQVTSSRHIVVCLLAKNLMKLLYICTCVFLIYDILEYVYHSACDKKKNSVQLDPYLLQRKYIFRIYISNLITTRSSSPYKVVLVSMVIVIVLLTQHVKLVHCGTKRMSSVLATDWGQCQAFWRRDRDRRLALHWCVLCLRLVPCILAYSWRSPLDP